MDIGIQSRFHLHPHLLLAALPRSPFQCLERAQNDLCLAPDFCGAFSLLPVARLYLARPFAVKPPPAETESFSPRPTERLGFLSATSFRLAGLRFRQGSANRLVSVCLALATFSGHLLRGLASIFFWLFHDLFPFLLDFLADDKEAATACFCG
jgi:hypothetical protein